MAKLEATIQLKIDSVFASANEYYAKNDLNKVIELLEGAWLEIPDPQYVYDDSYRVAYQLVRMLLRVNQLNQAKKWVEILQDCDPERINTGVKEFLYGKVLYELGDMDLAKQKLTLANEISEGQCFQGEDRKYKNFIK